LQPLPSRPERQARWCAELGAGAFGEYFGQTEPLRWTGSSLRITTSMYRGPRCRSFLVTLRNLVAVRERRSAGRSGSGGSAGRLAAAFGE
jgi:hypothetical protein